MCALDGVTMIAASPLGAAFNSYHIGHAVRVFNGSVRSITILNSGHTGGLAVVDAAGVPFGSYVSKSAGGFVFLGEETAPLGAGLLPSEVSPNSLYPGNLTNVRGSPHALLFGVSGQTQGRLAIEADGSMRYGDGVDGFDTTVHRPRSAAVTWDPPELAAGAAVSHRVSLPRAALGDLATVTHTGIVGDDLVQLTAIAQDGGVACVLRNAGTTPLDIGAGTLRVATTAFHEH
jgi:hypothetical protein